jgi:SNF2-related domain
MNEAIKITYLKDRFIGHCNFDEHNYFKEAGFTWDNEFKRWTCKDFRPAYKLKQYCDQSAIIQLKLMSVDTQKGIEQSAKTVGSIKIYHPETITPFPYQIAGVEYMLNRNAVLLADEMGLGKEEWVENCVFTPTGRKRIGSVIIGDKVIGSDGNAYNITGVFPQGIKDLYRVTFNDGASVLVGKEHLWTVFTRNIHRGRKDNLNDRKIVLTTEQLLDKKLTMRLKGTDWNEKRPYEFSTYYVEKNGNLKWQIPVVKPINFTNKDILPIEPYLMGLTLGDGHIGSGLVEFGVHKNDFEELFKYYDIKEKKKYSKRPNIRTCSINLKVGVEFLGLQEKKSNNKFIPYIYKYSSIDNRLALLQGLMDTDGHCMVGKNKIVFYGTEYCTVSEQLANDVCEIVHSLGGIARIKSKIGSYTKNGVKHICQKAYRINIKMPHGINPFRLKRKADRYNPPEKYKVARYIKDIKFEKVGEAVCIKVDAPDQLYVTEHGIVTHNTGQAFLVMNMRRNVEALIVCPAILKYNWLKEARKWLVGKVTAYIYESKKIRYYTKQLTSHNKTTILHIINYDILGKFRERLLGTPYNFFVADECHFIKNQDAFRTKIAQELAKKVLWRIFITGTPIYNKPKDLFVPLNLIDPNTFSNFYAFATRYCGAKKMMMAGRSILKFDGATNMDELNQILRSNYMVRRMTKDVLKDLPEKMKDVIVLNEESLEGIVKQEQNVLIKSKNEQATLKLEIEQLRQLVRDNSAYESLYKDKVKKMKESKFKSFGELSRLRKEMGLKKLPYVVEFVKDILENSEDSLSKVVVFGHHTQVLEGIFAGLKKYSPVIVTGKVLDKDRQKAIGLFKEKNKCRVFIGSMGASGVGVDGLQNNCNTVVFAELDWTPALVEQAEARLARIGQTLPVFVYHIVADGSIDSHIAKLMVSKTAVAKEILDYRPEQIYEKFIEQATT